VMFRHEGREANFEAHNLGQIVLGLAAMFGWLDLGKFANVMMHVAC
jgi:hypothetical protein